MCGLPIKNFLETDEFKKSVLTGSPWKKLVAPLQKIFLELVRVEHDLLDLFGNREFLAAKIASKVVLVHCVPRLVQQVESLIESRLETYMARLAIDGPYEIAFNRCDFLNTRTQEMAEGKENFLAQRAPPLEKIFEA